MYTLYHIHKPPKIQYSCHWDSAGRPKAECRGILNLEELQQVFFLKLVVRPSKKSTAAFATPGKIPQISPETQNLANYDKVSNDLR